MLCGTRVFLMNAKNTNTISGDFGRVSSRKKNGWLRITIERTGKTVSVRNIKSDVHRVGKIDDYSLLTCLNLRIQKLEKDLRVRDTYLNRAKDIIREYQARCAKQLPCFKYKVATNV